MNANRRSRLREARRILVQAQTAAEREHCITEEIKEFLSRARDVIEDVLIEEDEARDNIPESLQNSERYELSEQCSESMENAIDSIDDTLESDGETNSIGDAIESLEEAI